MYEDHGLPPSFFYGWFPDIILVTLKALPSGLYKEYRRLKEEREAAGHDPSLDRMRDQAPEKVTDREQPVRDVAALYITQCCYILCL